MPSPTAPPVRDVRPELQPLAPRRGLFFCLLPWTIQERYPIMPNQRTRPESARVMRRLELPKPGEDIDPEFLRRLGEIERAAIRYDWQFRIPSTQIRFGLDPLAGVVPIVGDLVMAVMSARLVLAARSLGIDGKSVRRMWRNIGIDVLIGIIPFVGPLFDVFFRSNLRNLQILLECIEQSRGPASQ